MKFFTRYRCTLVALQIIDNRIIDRYSDYIKHRQGSKCGVARYESHLIITDQIYHLSKSKKKDLLKIFFDFIISVIQLFKTLFYSTFFISYFQNVFNSR